MHDLYTFLPGCSDKKYLLCAICLLGLSAICFLIYKMFCIPFWLHFKPIKFNEIDIISGKISSIESKVIIAARGADVYKIVAYFYANNSTYVFKDEFYYNDSLFASRIKKIMENEELPDILILIEKDNIKKYKMKGCEYVIDLKYKFPQYFI